jgi:hypothetical protein
MTDMWAVRRGGYAALQRLCAIAVLTAPVTYRQIVDEPQLLGAA